LLAFIRDSQIVGAGPRTAARQAAALLALAGVLALVGTALTPDGAGRLLVVAGADLGTAAAAWWLPWSRWRRHAPLALAVPSLAVLGVATWAFGGLAAGTGPFFVLLFAWLGLNFPPWAAVAVTPAALAAYVWPLLATGQPAAVVGSAVVLLPVALGVALLIAHQVAHQRRDRERLARAEGWRAALTAGLAHDLRSPLTTVQLALEALGEDGPAARRELAATALRQVRRVNRLATELLDLERVDRRGELRLDLAQVSAREAVLDAVEQLDRPDVTVLAEPGLTVTADPQRLQQMLVNLLGNALRHGRPPVVVRATAAGAAARIEVRDHGPGVPPGDREELFTAFRARADRADSTGLGLWLVDRLALAHGGQVRYEPADPGARLVLLLPRAGHPGGGPRRNRWESLDGRATPTRDTAYAGPPGTEERSVDLQTRQGPRSVA
jgi:signal transduction histidine kinase